MRYNSRHFAHEARRTCLKHLNIYHHVVEVVVLCSLPAGVAELFGSTLFLFIKEEIWETHHKHIFMGAQKYDNKHGVGILLNKKWKERIIDTEYINERAISTNRQRIKLMSVYFAHSGYADHTSGKCTQRSRSTLKIAKDTNYNHNWWRLQCRLGVGLGNECKSVGRYTLNEGNKRGDWMKHWMMLQDYTALNTMYRKSPQKQTTFISPKGKERRIDYILTKRRYWRHAKDAEANDMIHMGSDHRCVMATFTITMPEKNIHTKNTRKQDTNEHDKREQAEQNIEAVKPELEKIQRDH